MITCSHCHGQIAEGVPRCPHCGERLPDVSGVIHTSTVLISSAGTEHVYRSIDEVPPQLRTRLLKSTNSADSRTILIADPKGRHQIDKAIRRLPGPAQKRMLLSLLSYDDSPDVLAWLTPSRRRWISGLVALLALALTAAVFLHRWK